MDKQVTVQLTLREAQELNASVASMLGRLRKDRHVRPEEIALWETMSNKLCKAIAKA